MTARDRKCFWGLDAPRPPKFAQETRRVPGPFAEDRLGNSGRPDGRGPARRSPAPPAPKPTDSRADIELVERLLAARRDYQGTLEQLRSHYLATGDVEKSRWAEEELRQYHRMNKPAYVLELDVPPPTLQAAHNIPEANELYRRAMTYKDKGWGDDYVDNQRRAEMLLQQLLTQYPQSDKIGDAAYQLGDLYESKAYKQSRRAAQYFERAFQWSPNTQQRLPHAAGSHLRSSAGGARPCRGAVPRCHAALDRSEAAPGSAKAPGRPVRRTVRACSCSVEKRSSAVVQAARLHVSDLQASRLHHETTNPPRISREHARHVGNVPTNPARSI